MKNKNLKPQFFLSKESQCFINEIFQQLNPVLNPLQLWRPNQVKKAITQILNGETPRDLFGSENKKVFQLICNLIKYIAKLESKLREVKRISSHSNKTPFSHYINISLLLSKKHESSLNPPKNQTSTNAIGPLNILISKKHKYPAINSPPK